MLCIFINLYSHLCSPAPLLPTILSFYTKNTFFCTHTQKKKTLFTYLLSKNILRNRNRIVGNVITFSSSKYKGIKARRINLELSSRKQQKREKPPFF